MNDWPVKTLGEVCEFQNGYAFKSSEYVRNGHALIRIKNVQQGEIVLNDDVFVQIPKDGSLNQFVLNSGDILMSLTGYLGRVGRLDETDLPAALNQRVAKVSVKSKASIFDGFLYRVLDSQWFRDQVEVYGRGAAQQNVGTSDISKIEIPVPPLEEQKRIVALLDAATARVTELTACYEQARTHANNLFTSALRDALESNPDWPVKTLGDLCDIYQPQTIGTKDLIADGKYIVYGANGPIGRYDRFNHEKSEVTVTCRGATCGTVNVTPPEVWITGNAMVVRPNEMEMSKAMIRYVLEGLDYSQIITGAAQPQITRQTLAPSTIQVPSLEEQKRIVARLDLMRAKTSEMVAAYDAKLTAAKNLRQSILESAFAGDL